VKFFSTAFDKKKGRGLCLPTAWSLDYFQFIMSAHPEQTGIKIVPKIIIIKSADLGDDH